MTAPAKAGSWAARAGCVAALLWLALLLLLHWAAGALACYSDTSYCAESRAKNGVYRGVLTDRRGRTVTSTPFTVAFESRRDARDVAGFSTDAQGRYCIVWAQERITPFARVDGSEAIIDTPWRPLDGARPPHGCQAGDGGIPWNRADDLRSSAQFVALPAIAILSAILLLVGLSGTPTGRRARRLGLLATAASTVLAVLIWVV